MLQAIRSRAGSWVVKSLFILLALSFVAWGVEGYIQSSQHPTTVATIGSVKLDQPAMGRRLSAEIQRFQQAFGGAIDRTQMKQLGLIDQALDRIVNGILLDQEAERLGVVVSDNVVRQAIETNPAFLDDQGKFDRSKFAALINRGGYGDERSFIAEIRRQMASSQILRSVGAVQKAPDILIDTLARYRGEKRVATTLFIGDDQIVEVAKPTEADLKTFHEQHPDLFTAPEFRALSYATLSVDQLKDAGKPTDQEIKEAYDSRVDEFTQPEMRNVEQLPFPDEAAAKAASDKIIAGGSFADAAKAAKVKPEDLALGDVSKADLPPAIAEIVFALAAEKVSAPVKTDFGWTLFRVASIKPGFVETLDAVRGRLSEEIAVQHATDALYDRVNKLETALDSGASLDDAAKQQALKILKIAAIDATGKTPDGVAVPDLPAPAKLTAAAFALKDGQTGRPVEIRDQGLYFVVRVDSITAPALKPLSEVHDQAVAAVNAERRRAAAKVKAEELVAKLKSGATLADLAKADHRSTAVSPAFSRDGKGADDLPPEVIGKMFDAATVGSAAIARGRNDNGYLVAQLAEIRKVEGDADKELRTLLEREAKRSIQTDLIDQYQAGLHIRYPVTIDRKATESLF